MNESSAHSGEHALSVGLIWWSLGLAIAIGYSIRESIPTKDACSGTACWALRAQRATAAMARRCHPGHDHFSGRGGISRRTQSTLARSLGPLVKMRGPSDDIPPGTRLKLIYYPGASGVVLAAGDQAE